MSTVVSVVGRIVHKHRKNSLELNGWTEAAMSGALAERVAVRTGKPPERGTNGGCEPPASGARVECREAVRNELRGTTYVWS